MAPLQDLAMAAGPSLLKRDLTVNHTQAVTLGVMAAYVVVIALLWNLPYVRWSLWPFKVISLLTFQKNKQKKVLNHPRCWSSHSMNSAMP